MPKKASCCCPRHDNWGHVSIQDAELRVATEKEKRFCGVNTDGRHNDRKRKICQFCRNRIALEVVCKDIQDKLSVNHEDDTEQGLLDLGSDDQIEHSMSVESPQVQSADDHVENSISVESPQVQDLSDNKATVDNGTQVGEPIPRLPYQQYESRKKTEIRTAVINNIHGMLLSYVHDDESAVKDLLQDVLDSRKWQSTFGDIGISHQKKKDDQFLQALVDEYKTCKEKETNIAIKQKGRKLQQPIKIASTRESSKIAFEGPTPQQFKSRVQAAKSMGRVNTYGAERRRLLSIVALEYPQTFLINLFKCSKSTVTAARVHCHLFGRGGMPPPKLKFTRQCVSQDVLDGLAEFLVQDNVSRPSSCRSVVVNKEECPVRYWQDSVKALIQQYLLEFPNGVKRTYIYTHIPKNFRHNSMLAGLCNLCEDYGYSNFENLISLVKKVSSEAVQVDLSGVVQDIRDLQRYLKSKFSNEAQRHSSCLELCMKHALDSCSMDHYDHSPEYDKVYKIYDKIDAAVRQVPSQARQEYREQMQDFQKNFSEYVGHIIRTKHQSEYYRYVLSNLKCGEAVVIIDYKMKLELGMHVREIQRDWYGKRGISIHGFYVIAQVSENEKKIEVLDLWSEDTKQDAWFTQSALDIGFGWMEKALPGFSVCLFSDNGPHYHNTAVLLYLAEVNRTFNIKILEYNNFEAGEGKTVLDTHFAHISHKLIRWVRVGNNLDTGEQLAELLQSMKNVRCKKLVINRANAPSKIGTLKDISLFGNFKFPTTGPHKSGIILQSLAGIGRELKKTNIQLQSLSSRTTLIANNTGATVTDEIWQPSDVTVTGSCRSEPYSVNFIQQPSDPIVPTHLIPLSDRNSHALKPLAGFALKKGGAKRVTFTEEQKSIMIYFYNRQKISQIRADPKDVILQMRNQGIPELKESQIKSWWSTYHRKQKQLAEDLVTESRQIMQQQDADEVTQRDDASESDVMHETDDSDAEPSTADPSPSHPTNQTTAPSSQPIIGQPSPRTPQVMEWTFNESQSNIGGRTGSNACCFIALCMGSLMHINNLTWPKDDKLSVEWEETFRIAMLKGNAIHDDLFDFSAVNLDIDDAVAMAGDECKVDKVANQVDIFGSNPVNQLEDNIKRVVDNAPLPSYSVMVAHGRAVLLAVNIDKSAMILDSHSHGSRGAIIGFCKAENVSYLGCWFANMMQNDWGTALTIASFSRIEYESIP